MGVSPSCNDLPQLPVDDDGTWRRLEAVPFESKFVTHPNQNNPNEFIRDEQLSIKMKTWIQLGETPHSPLSVFLEEGSQRNLGSLEQYKTQVDDVQQFIDEHLIVDQESVVTWADLLESYNQYKNANIRTNSKESAELRKQMIAKKFHTNYIPIKIDSKTCKGWKGFRLKIEDSNDQENLNV